MAKNIVINSVTYPGTPGIQVPISGGGTATFYETSDATVTAETLASGATAYGPAGKVVGTMTAASVSQDSTTKIVTIS